MQPSLPYDPVAPHSPGPDASLTSIVFHVDDAPESPAPDSLDDYGLSQPLLTPPRPRFHQRRSSAASFDSQASSESRYPTRLSSYDKISSASDPSGWNIERGIDQSEPDDYLHEPDPRSDRSANSRDSVFTIRGFINIGFLVLLALALLGLFAGYPVIEDMLTTPPKKLGGHNIGGVNGSGQVAELSNRFALVDPDTPESALYYTSHRDGSKWQLMFSDEFNVDGRSFYPGDDPYWEAVDLHYWATGDMEWYDPSAAGTQGGSLRLFLSREDNHDLHYKSGHIASWNKFCFTGGYIEVNVSLPGTPALSGYWPAVWMMGNLGRAGYGATTDGLWPYSYDACDWGTLPNQTYGDLPTAAFSGNDGGHGGVLSYQSGQRLSACTCSGDPNHPGPPKSDGTFVGRMSPEIDIIEASSFNGIGSVSQSVQVAPFNAAYNWSDGANDVTVYNSTATILNTYKGGIYQEAVSALTDTDQSAYEVTGGYATYGIEYMPGDDGYITWFSDGKPTWSVFPSAIGPDPLVNISARIISPEPMYLIMNLGYSHGFGEISPNLMFPAVMSVDYIRVYQNPDLRNVGCSPKKYPTEAYINQHIDIYTNPNYTTFSGDAEGSYGGTRPKNKLVDVC